ncbi:MAG TPA: patatin-like phospholipase family protein [Candidatus Bathyarchaeia archaeon]|nr:patatin-like phospholipase family protein [Candidatus Bathyarchaeia archaeon]
MVRLRRRRITAAAGWFNFYRASVMGRKMENTIGLVMTGGGARGAYQAGILKRIGEIKRVQTHGNPFPIIGGSSAGALMVLPLPEAATILLRRPRFSHRLGRVSDLPISFTVMFYRRPAIPLPGY